MLKRGNKESVCSPVGFSEELIEVSKLKSISNWPRNKQKAQNFTVFKVFMQFLSNFRQTSWIGMLKKCHQSKSLLSSSLL